VIVKKSPQEIESMAAAGLIQAAALDIVAGKIRPGVSTQELDETVERFIRSQGATPTF
jgi:methionyl aminopeptidase